MNNFLYRFLKRDIPVPEAEPQQTKPVEEEPFDVRIFEETNSINQQKIPISGPGKFDQYSQTWIYIENYCNKRLDTLRSKNDTRGLDVSQTENIRGQIHELKELLNHPKSLRKKNDRLGILNQ